MADLIVTSAAGLNTFRRALEVTGHNIANVNTDGYSRQNVVIRAGTPQLTGGGYIGSGAYVSSVERAWTGFLGDQMNNAYSYQNKYKTADIYSTQLNGTLGDPNSGVYNAMEDYFNSWSDVANDPTLYTNRSTVLNKGALLSQQVNNYLDTGYSLNQQVNSHLNAAADKVNSLLGQISELNTQVNNVYLQTNAPANDLKDKRDTLIKELNQYIDVKTHETDTGIADIYTGVNGNIPLLTDNRVVALEVDYRSVDESGVPGEEMDLWIHQPGTNQRVNITKQIQGGELGGALSFRNDQLARAQDEFGLSIAGMALVMNAQSRQGFDTNGDQGTNLFSLNDKDSRYVLNDPNLAVDPDYTNALAEAGVASFATKEDQDYYLSSVNYFRTTEQTAYLGRENRSDVTMSVNLISASTVGDKSLKTFTDANGDGVSDDLASVMKDVSALKPRDYMIAFDGTNYAINDKRTGENISFSKVTDASGVEGLEFEGLRIVPSDVPKAGDKFEVQFLRDATKSFSQEVTDPNKLAYRGGDPTATPAYSTPLGIGNNMNAANMTGLRDKSLLMGGKEDFQGAFSLAATNVGNYHSANKLSLDAQNALYQQLDDTKQSIAGVSLDEEAANLMKFQQSYQAAAQTMQAAQKMFDVLIGAIQ